MVSDNGKGKRPQIPGTLPRSAPAPVGPGNTGKPRRTQNPPQRRATPERTPKRASDQQKPARRTGRATTQPATSQRATAPQRAAKAPRKAPATVDNARRNRIIIRVISFVLGAAILIAAGLFIKSKMDDHKETIAAVEQETPDTIEPCTPGELSMATTVSGTTVGKPTTFDITIENTSEGACSLDIGKSSLVVTVTSGDDTVWKSDHCVVDAPSNLYVFGPGVSSTISVGWNGQRSTADCQSGLAVPGAGQYVMTGAVGGVEFNQLRTVFNKGD